MKNVFPSYHKWQFRFVAEGALVSDSGYETERAAGFVCDLCKEILFDVFGRKRHHRLGPSLELEDFCSDCRSAGLNPEDPSSFLSYQFLPARFVEFVQTNREKWEREQKISQESKTPADREVAEARQSTDPALRWWAVRRLGLVQKIQQLKMQPVGWWANYISGLRGHVNGSRELLSGRFQESLINHFSADSDALKLREELDEDLKCAAEKIELLNRSMLSDLKQAEDELASHDKNKPAFDPNRKFWQDEA